MYRQAQIESNLASKGWIPSAVDNQISAFNQGKYITADGRQMDWFDVPALPYGNQNKWLLETEYQTLQHQMDGHLTAQFSRIDGISLENTIPFGTHPVTRKPNMRSLNSFMENGRWKQEAIYDEYTNPEGFIDLDFKTGNYIFKGDAGAAVLDIFAKYGVVIEAQEALEMSLGIGLSRIDRRMADTAENGKIVVALIDDHEAMLKRLRRKGKTVALESANKNYETKIFGPDRVKVQGVLVSLYRNF